MWEISGVLCCAEEGIKPEKKAGCTRCGRVAWSWLSCASR